ncbi:MAG: serine/threonine protein kinase [Ignavibacteria bacterium]|nr:serine/threonine protein kinase [Ignavibacteria bacterium]
MIEKIRDYKIIEKLGEGGMGTVYLAEDTMLERKVALKVLNPLFTKESQFTERFRHEAKVQASLIHPNIVTLHNYFRESENYCMVMENVEGVTLKHLISGTGPIPEKRAIWILIQMLEAVGFAHKKGIIHRDIKPSNILVSKDDNVKILDFGIAKILRDKGHTKTGTKLGTVYYMSPEQIKAVKDIDQRTDIYSLGITFY